MTPAEFADSLTGTITGTVLTPGDPSWDAARRFHSGIGEPELILRAADTADVRAAVVHAAPAGLEIGVRGGGHSVWGTVPGGMLIDLADLDDVEVDPATRIVGVGGGAVWGAVAAALAPHGLGLSSGDTASVGVGGLTLGGGIGWMVRAWGLAIDQLVGAEVVTAAGEVVRADAETHPDLFWALRGGGGNFGVVTRFFFAAHPLPGVVFAEFAVAGDRAEVLHAARDVMRDAPRSLTLTYMDVPPMDPSAPAGATVTAVWIGDGDSIGDTDVAAARAVLAPIVAVEGVSEVSFGVRAYPDILLDAPAADPDAPMPGFVGGNALFADLDDDAIGDLVAFRAAREAAVLFLRSVGGAYGDVSPRDTAYSARDAHWFAMAGAFDIPGVLDDPEGVNAEWARIEARGHGSYGNFFNTLDPEWAHRMYPDEVWDRLAAVKRHWDPRNVFCRNYNVPPA